MYYKKKLVALLLIVGIISSLSIFAQASEKPDADNCEDSMAESFVIDWSDYQEKLFNKKYKLRIHENLEFEIESIVLSYLVTDGIIPANAISAHSLAFDNEYLFSKFMDENVIVEPFGQVCCDQNMSKSWETVVEKASYPYGTCTRHCLHQALVCTNCRAVWDNRHLINKPSGCGRPELECPQHIWGHCYK